MEKKKEVLDLIDKGVSQRAIAVQFGVAKSTVGNIKKNRDSIMKAWEENCSNERKRKLGRTDNENVNSVTYSFFKMLWNEYSC
jgi:IS30 family transposase